MTDVADNLADANAAQATPDERPRRARKAPDKYRSSVSRDPGTGLWIGVYWPPKADVGTNLGSFAHKHEADRAVEDAVAQHRHNSLAEETVETERQAQIDAEQARMEAEHEAHSIKTVDVND